MWRKHAIFEIDRTLLAAALLAAHASYQEQGLRQRDLKFFFELFGAWSREFFHGERIQPNNMQIARVLRRFVAEGLARLSKRTRVPRYKLTRAGVLEATRMLVSEPSPTRIEDALFSLYFLRNYGSKIEDLIRSSAEQFPPSIASEVRALLDLQELKRILSSKLSRQIQQLEQDTKNCHLSTTLGSRVYNESQSLDEVALALQSSYPYHLNAQKPLRELYPELPPEIAKWELLEGPKVRAKEMWDPLLQILRKYRKMIEEF